MSRYKGSDFDEFYLKYHGITSKTKKYHSYKEAFKLACESMADDGDNDVEFYRRKFLNEVINKDKQ